MSKDVKFLIEQILVDVKEGYLTERARWKSAIDKSRKENNGIDMTDINFKRTTYNHPEYSIDNYDNGEPNYVKYFEHPEIKRKNQKDIKDEEAKIKEEEAKIKEEEAKMGFFSKILKRLLKSDKSNKPKTEVLDPEVIKKFAKDVYDYYNKDKNYRIYAPSAIIQDFKKFLWSIKNYMITFEDHANKGTVPQINKLLPFNPEYEKNTYKSYKQYYALLSKIILSPIFEQTLEYYYKLNTSATANRSPYSLTPSKHVITSDSRKLKSRYSDV